MQYLNHITAFLLASGPVALAVGALGHAIVAISKPGSLPNRVGIALEGFGTDWKHISEAFKPAVKP